MYTIFVILSRFYCNSFCGKTIWWHFFLFFYQSWKIYDVFAGTGKEFGLCKKVPCLMFSCEEYWQNLL